ncbi:MAG: DUF2341 domain-containing protein, partial [Spirochaetaceae bacterium]|nr:DUF2341 domain-containing protein [Spirochaetaceae bacterium]
MKLSIDNTASSEDLINFPILIRLNPSRINYNRIKADASDISFKSSDGMVTYSHEIEGTWNSSGESILWVKIPSLAAGQITDIWLYYSSETEAGDLNPTAVWDSTYNAVWHLGENGTTFNDSTSSGNTGTGGS